jgi:hypothetical protein
MAACGDERPPVTGPDAGDSDPVPGQLCSGGWCWESPAPQGNDLTAVWSFGPSDLWAAGSDATVIHWDGATWSYAGPVPPGESDAPFTGMWASGPRNLWLWGPTGLWRWDGARWNRMSPGGRVASVSGTGPRSVVAVGERGLVARWDGETWTESSVGSGWLTRVWAVGDEVWAAGPVPGDNLEDIDSVLWHHDGATWSSERREGGIADIWGAAVDDVYLSGGTVMHWDGAAWTSLDLAIWAGRMWATSASDVWVFDWSAPAALHFDGASWSAADLPPLWVARAASGTGPGDTWMVGDHGRIARWDGAAWRPVGGAPVGSELSWPRSGLWGPRGDHLWAAAESGLARWDGVEWQAEPVAGHYAAVWGDGGNLWAAGGYGARAFRHDAVWDATSGTGPPHFDDVWSSSATDAWAVGDAIHHHDGSEWTEVRDLSDLGVAMRGVWGTGESDVWAVGDGGTILHWNGSAWLTSPTGTTDSLGAVWGAGESDVWAAGSRYDDGAFHIAILRWNGERWTSFAGPPDDGIADALRGTSSDDLWLSARHTGASGGLSSRLYHWDGATWTEEHPPTRQYIGALWGWGPGQVAITAHGGLLRRYPGAPR